jgi:hypothetical protein
MQAAIIEGIMFKNGPGIATLLLKKSVLYKEGIIHINNTPFYRLLPNKDYSVQTEYIKNMYTLSINNRMIYENTTIFKYSIHMKRFTPLQNS